MKRVVITGMGGVTAFGDSWEAVQARLARGENAVRDESSCMINRRLEVAWRGSH